MCRPIESTILNCSHKSNFSKITNSDDGGARQSHMHRGFSEEAFESARNPKEFSESFSIILEKIHTIKSVSMRPSDLVGVRGLRLRGSNRSVLLSARALLTGRSILDQSESL